MAKRRAKAKPKKRSPEPEEQSGGKGLKLTRKNRVVVPLKLTQHWRATKTVYVEVSSKWPSHYLNQIADTIADKFRSNKHYKMEDEAAFVSSLMGDEVEGIEPDFIGYPNLTSKKADVFPPDKLEEYAKKLMEKSEK